MNIYITRHGETMWNTEKRFQGWKDSPLTEKGRQMAVSLGSVFEKYNIDTVFCSPLKRARDTAELALGYRDIPMIFIDELKEMNLGEWEGKCLDELKEKEPEKFENYWNHPDRYMSDTGENFNELIERIKKAIEKIREHKEVRNALVVTHGMSLKAFLHIFSGEDFTKVLKEPVLKQTSVTGVRLLEKGGEIMFKGDTSHLDDEDRTLSAEILTVGTEILLGDILNTNAQYIAQGLAEMGIGVYRHTSVGDNEARLKEAIESALENSNIVITTGGLGPTGDDITKETCAKALGKELVVHEKSMDTLKYYFRNNDTAIKNGNGKQAMFPADSIILDNPNGTAPGCIMSDDNGRYIILMPGPPKEMVPMFDDSVKPFLRKLTGKTIESRVMRFSGIGEWEMAHNVKDLSEMTNPTVAPYAKEGECILRITAIGHSDEECQTMINPVCEEIRRRMPDKFYAYGEDTLEDIVPELLLKYGLTIATAESLTGGLLASTIINCDKGISGSFMEGVITYSNESKIERLGVSPETLKKYGAVSENTALEMARGLKERAKTDIAISTTGIAGPKSDNTEKPVGLYYIGIVYKDREYVYEGSFRGTRNKIRRRVVLSALEKLLRLIEAEYGKYAE